MQVGGLQVTADLSLCQEPALFLGSHHLALGRPFLSEVKVRVVNSCPAETGRARREGKEETILEQKALRYS